MLITRQKRQAEIPELTSPAWIRDEVSSTVILNTRSQPGRVLYGIRTVPVSYAPIAALSLFHRKCQDFVMLACGQRANPDDNAAKKIPAVSRHDNL
jgi:hypothetical protein